MKKLGVIILVSILALVVVFGLVVVQPTALFSAGANKETIKIGWIGPLSGGESSIGIPNMQGVKLAVKEINATGGINGKNVEVVFEDEQSSGSKEAITAFHKLSSIDQTKSIFIVKYSNFLDLVPLAENNNRIIISNLDTSEELAGISENAFAVGIYDDGIGHTLAEFAVNKLEAKKAAIISKNDEAFMEFVKKGFINKFAELGGELVSIESYSGYPSDFRSILQKTKEKEPEVIALVGFEEIGFVLKQAKELGINATFVGIDTSTSETFLRNAGNSAEGLYFSFWEPNDSEISTNFFKNFKKEFGKNPEQILFAATGYDAMNLLAEAMKNCADLQDVNCIKIELKKIENLKGLSGTLTMSQDNIVRSVAEKMYQMKSDGNYTEALDIQ